MFNTFTIIRDRFYKVCYKVCFERTDNNLVWNVMKIVFKNNDRNNDQHIEEIFQRVKEILTDNGMTTINHQLIVGERWFEHEYNGDLYESTEIIVQMKFKTIDEVVLYRLTHDT